MTRPWMLPKSLRTRFVVGGIVVLSSVVAVAATLDSRPAAARAVEWVARHAQDLPGTLDEYAAYPTEYRREIRRALSPEMHSRLWRAQLRGFLAERPDLTAEQRSFVEYVIEVASPESFQPGANPPELCPQIAKLFPNAGDRERVAKLGAGVSAAFSLRPALVSLKERIHASLTAKAGGDECNCRGMGICECSLLDACVSNTCVPAEDCGCVFVGWCSKVCEFILNTMTSEQPSEKTRQQSQKTGPTQEKGPTQKK